MNSERNALKARYRELFKVVEAIFNEYDPMGIYVGDNPDEYDLEVGTVLPRLKEAKNIDDVAVIVQEELINWFDEDNAGKEPDRVVNNMAKDIWAAWMKFSRPLA